VKQSDICRIYLRSPRGSIYRLSMRERRVEDPVTDSANDVILRLEELLQVQAEPRPTPRLSLLELLDTPETPDAEVSTSGPRGAIPSPAPAPDRQFEESEEPEHLRARERADERRADRRRDWNRVSRRSAIIAVSGGLIVTMGLPTVASALLGSHPDSEPQSSTAARPAPSGSPTTSATTPATTPSAAAPTVTALPSVPVHIDFAGTQPPVIVVVQPSEGEDYGQLIAIGTALGGLATLVGAIASIIFALKGRRGDAPPAGTTA